MNEQANPGAAGFLPDVGPSYGNGWQQLWKHFGELLIIVVISAVISSVVSIPTMVMQLHGDERYASMLWNTVTFIFGILISGPVSFGMSYASLKAARAQKVEIMDLFMAFKNYGNAVGAYVLMTLIVIGGFILLIVPGIIFACKLAFVPFLVTDKQMGAVAAIQASWRMTNGHAGTIFLMGLLSIPLFIAGVICLGVGVFIAGMWVNVASASLYYAVTGKDAPPVTALPTT